MSSSAGKSGEVIKVFVRVRPPISHEVHHENCMHTQATTSIHLRTEKHDIKCAYDRVFGELDGQDAVFEEIKPLLDDVLSGFNACVFAYGQTSAGKTHTMIGPKGGQNLEAGHSEWGVLPRASEFLFSELEAKAAEGGFTYSAKASFLQIYNEKLFDLLGGHLTDDSSLKIREIPRKSPHTLNTQSASTGPPCEVFISGLSEFRVQTADDILRILAVGSAARATRSTNFNATSSRSHAILQIGFEMESVQSSGQTMIFRSKLSLVDLAGSEKMQAIDEHSHAASDHLKELTSINQSLSSLGNVIAALASKNRSHVPYRDSKLTRILQDSLGGNTRTILITCVAPTVIHAAESMSTLQFADRAKNIMVKAKANLVIDDKVLLTNAQSEIARLKLLLKQALLKIERLTSVAGGDQAAVPLRLEDGETSEELDRVLQENKRLRRENANILKELQGIRNGRLWGKTKAIREGGPRSGTNKKGGKPEWANSLVDDGVYRDTRSRGSRRKDGGVRQSRTSPCNSVAAGVASGDGTNAPARTHENSSNGGSLPTVCPSRIKQQVLPVSKKYRIRDALDMESVIPGAALGSPSKSSIEAVHKVYFDANYASSVVSEDEEGNCDDDGDTLDVDKLREKLRRAQDCSQMQNVEMKLNGASNVVMSQLEADQRELERIQFSRAELERQLNELQRAAAAEDNDSDEGEGNTTVSSPTLSPVMPASAVPPPKPTKNSQITPPSLSASAGLEPSFDKNQDAPTNLHPPANLTYSKADAGRIIEIYIFRYNTWEPLELIDFEPSKKLHKCRHVDKSEKWLDLKKKPIRSRRDD